MDRWVEMTRWTMQGPKRCWQAAIVPKLALQMLALQLQDARGSRAAPGSVPLP